MPKKKRTNGRGPNESYDEALTKEEVDRLPSMLDKHDAARIFGMHPETISRLARKGEIPGRIVGQRWVFSKARLLKLVEEA